MEDPFDSKVTLDISSEGYDNPDEIENLIKDHIREKRSIGTFTVSLNQFSFRNFGGESNQIIKFLCSLSSKILFSIA